LITAYSDSPILIRYLMTGISYQRGNNQYVKYTGNVGQDLVESIFSFVYYKLIPVIHLNSEPDEEGLINLG